MVEGCCWRDLGSSVAREVDMPRWSLPVALTRFSKACSGRDLLGTSDSHTRLPRRLGKEPRNGEVLSGASDSALWKADPAISGTLERRFARLSNDSGHFGDN